MLHATGHKQQPMQCAMLGADVMGYIEPDAGR